MILEWCIMRQAEKLQSELSASEQNKAGGAGTKASAPCRAYASRISDEDEKRSMTRRLTPISSLSGSQPGMLSPSPTRRLKRAKPASILSRDVEAMAQGQPPPKHCSQCLFPASSSQSAISAWSLPSMQLPIVRARIETDRGSRHRARGRPIRRSPCRVRRSVNQNWGSAACMASKRR